MPGQGEPGMLAPWGGGLLEVIGRPYVRGAFNRGTGSDGREECCGMVGAKLVVPVPIADVGVPDAGLAPQHFRRVEGQPRVFEYLGLGCVGCQGATGAEAAKC